MSQQYPFQEHQPPPYRGWDYEPPPFPTGDSSFYTTQPERPSDITVPWHNTGAPDRIQPSWQSREVATESGRPPQAKNQRKASRPLIFFLVLALFALVVGITAATNPSIRQLSHSAYASLTGETAQRQKQYSGTLSPQVAKPAPQPASLPAAWIASGRGSLEAAEASVIAQGFVERYGSIETANPQALKQTLTSAELFLTPAARQRFSFPQGIRQTTLADGVPIVDPPQTVNGTFFAIITVPYTTFQNGGAQTIHQQMTVALIPIPFSGVSVPASMGWEVTAWQSGTTPPPLPLQP